MNVCMRRRAAAALVGSLAEPSSATFIARPHSRCWMATLHAPPGCTPRSRARALKRVEGLRPA